MLAQMPNRILHEWVEYNAIEPFGEYRADLRMGILASTIANCMVRRKNKPAFKPDQFMPEFKPHTWPTPDELLNKVRWLNRLYGGSVIKSE